MDKAGQLEGLTQSGLLTAGLKDAEVRGGRETSLTGDINPRVMLLPYSPKQLHCARTEPEGREEQVYEGSVPEGGAG